MHVPIVERLGPGDAVIMECKNYERRSEQDDAQRQVIPKHVLVSSTRSSVPINYPDRELGTEKRSRKIHFTLIRRMPIEASSQRPMGRVSASVVRDCVDTRLGTI